MEIEDAVISLIELGGAAVGQYKLGNAKGRTEIRNQIVQVGNKLKQLEGLDLMDWVTDELEKRVTRLIIREVILTWKQGVDGYTA